MNIISHEIIMTENNADMQSTYAFREQNSCGGC